MWNEKRRVERGKKSFPWLGDIYAAQKSRTKERGSVAKAGVSHLGYITGKEGVMVDH